MSITTENKRGIATLMVAHCAGMLDLVALPVWVGTLVGRYRFDPQQAGGLATLFLIGASIASIGWAPRIHRIEAKWPATLGFFLAAVAFLLASQNAAFLPLAALHLFGGFAAGTALSFTHGTIGRALNPHRVYAYAGLAIGVFAIVFLGGTPVLVARFGGPALFILFMALMILAGIMSLLFFPKPTGSSSHPSTAGDKTYQLSRGTWLTVGGIVLLAMTQAMTLSFYERIGVARGFNLALISVALITYGIVTLFPAPLAALFEKRVKATTVISVAPVMQAILAMFVTHTGNYAIYVASGSLMSFTIVFTHTYAFGMLARLDPLGRAVAGTPAMLMVGAAIGPFLGGTLVRFFGFHAIGIAAVVLVVFELLLFNLARRTLHREAQKIGPEPVFGIQEAKSLV